MRVDRIGKTPGTMNLTESQWRHPQVPAPQLCEVAGAVAEGARPPLPWCTAGAESFLVTGPLHCGQPGVGSSILCITVKSLRQFAQ